MDKEYVLILMERNMMENGKMITGMEMEIFLILMETNMMEIGKMII